MTATPRLRRAAPRPLPGEPDESDEADALCGRRPRRRHRVLRASLGVVLLIVLGGCSLLGLGTDPGSDGDATESPGAGAEWFWYQQGDRVASPVAPALPATGVPGGDDYTVTQTVYQQPSGSGRPYCLRRLRADTMYWLNATPGVGQAGVTWMSLGDPRIVNYKVAAVLQNRPGGSVPPAVWTQVPAPDGCQQVDVTVTGLLSGSWYVFWLDVVLTTAPTGRREPMIGRSPAFQVL
ncbi:hypothetical protein [Virgisporangium aurantiacum]|uniref:Fibronectin type-III domain-containing protein n=1 Tax=Virgisporangium aurantiacum TaxID=175570 RepID=A0A8J4E570_9ACTN|nr:hypothetical protein [Virgisporangium aurantiacum]GIJ62725.1 hypothetical protein Vau01_102410 [Virgisporangium aurantiacum]